MKEDVEIRKRKREPEPSHFSVPSGRDGIYLLTPLPHLLSILPMSQPVQARLFAPREPWGTMR